MGEDVERAKRPWPQGATDLPLEDAEDAALAQEVLDELREGDEELHDWDEVKAELGL